MAAGAFIKLLEPRVYESVKQQCNGQKSFEEMFTSVWDLKEAHKYMSPPLIIFNKSEDEADKLRTEGNGYYKKKNFKKALELYNQSIMLAPHPVVNEVVTSHSEPTRKDDCYDYPRIDPARYGGTADLKSKALAKGFANRSALLFEMNFYEKCMRDIDLALEYGYPENQQAKLEERKQKCLAAQNKELQDQDLSKQAPSMADTEDPNFDLESVIDKIIAESPECWINRAEPLSFKKQLSITPYKPKKIVDCNKSHPSLSSAVKINYTRSKGRGVVAVRDIHPGEMVVVESAYVVNIKEKNLSTYCSTCMDFCLTPLPCPSCIKVIFCSESCRKRGLTEEHWIECRILSTAIALEIPSMMWPFKLLKTITYNQLNVIMNQQENKQCDHPKSLGCNREGVYSSESYQTVCSLCTNKEQIPSETLVMLALFTFLFTHLLRESGRYFVNDDGDPITPSRKDSIKTGAVLLSHLCLLKMNHQDIQDIQQMSESIGPGVFPTASLMNHSCHPSVYTFTHGRQLCYRARRPIRAGEEVTSSYSHSFSHMSIEERKEILAGYYINCCCVACKNDWPLNEYLQKYKCLECNKGINDAKFVCSNCCFKAKFKSRKEIISLERKWLDMFKKVKWAWDSTLLTDYKLKHGERVTEKDFKVLTDSIEVVYKYMGMPCQTLCFLENTLGRCLEIGV